MKFIELAKRLPNVKVDIFTNFGVFDKEKAEGLINNWQQFIFIVWKLANLY